jgi:hypothetical protein
MSRSAAQVKQAAVVKIASKLGSLKERLKVLTAEAIQALVDNAKAALAKILEGLHFSLVSFKLSRNLLSNIIVKVASPRVYRNYNFGVFGEVSLAKLFNECVAEGYRGLEAAKSRFTANKRAYLDALVADFDFWLMEHGSILQALVGDVPKYNTFEEQSNILQQKLARKGEKVKLFLWATTKLMGKIALKGLILGLLAMTGLGIAFAYTAIKDIIDDFKEDEWGIVRDYDLMSRL